jgi:dTDP-glucose 4,6-dehydratase
MTILITGGAGFIGSNFILQLISNSSDVIINLDKLTYAGNIKNLKTIINNKRHVFIKGCISDKDLLKKVFVEYKPRAVINFAAESHVDRSINSPDTFIQTNILGTFHLLQESLNYWNNLPQNQKLQFRFLHISTDEVYGSLSPKDPAFTEKNRYEPNSPYSASKASSDHLVRSFHHTYGLPTLTTNCSNNYGPYQFPEKLIPLIITHALNGKPLPIYGDGLQIRDWLFVEDHCDAISSVLEKGIPGEIYNVGGCNEKSNIEIVKIVCSILDELSPNKNKTPYEKQITYVKDRPGHDRRYAINATKIMSDLGWKPKETFESGIRKTILWYLNNQDWIHDIQSGSYMDWIQQNYSHRQ